MTNNRATSRALVVKVWVKDPLAWWVVGNEEAVTMLVTDEYAANY